MFQEATPGLTPRHNRTGLNPQIGEPCARSPVLRVAINNLQLPEIVLGEGVGADLNLISVHN